MADSKDVAMAVSQLVNRKINELSPQFSIGVWVSNESAVDANLSQVVSGETTYRYVPKSTTATLAVGDQVLLMKSPGLPLIIVGRLSGNITLPLP